MHEQFMRLALREAENARRKGETPVGAVIVKDGVVLSCAHNLREQKQSPLCHAEMLAIEEACARLGQWRLCGCDMYVTLEPCPMCAGALLQSRIDNLYFGASDPKNGAVVSNVYMLDYTCFNHTVKYESGILKDECAGILTEFFEDLRKTGKT